MKNKTTPNEKTVEEKIVTIIMQAIAPYHKPYKYLGEKSIETAKNEILTSLQQSALEEKKELVREIYKAVWENDACSCDKVVKALAERHNINLN